MHWQPQKKDDRERERGVGEDRSHTNVSFIFSYWSIHVRLPCCLPVRSIAPRISRLMTLKPRPSFSSGAEMNESPAMKNKSSFGRALQNLNIQHIQKVSRLWYALEKGRPGGLLFESACAAHAVVIVGIIDFSCLQRQPGDICLSTFGSCLGEKKKKKNKCVLR